MIRLTGVGATFGVALAMFLGSAQAGSKSDSTGAAAKAAAASTDTSSNPITTSPPHGSAASHSDKPSQDRKAQRAKVEKERAVMQASSDKTREDFLKGLRERNKARREAETAKRTPSASSPGL